MAIYQWGSSRLMARYGRGDIIVSAHSVEQARTKARDAFKTWVVSEHGFAHSVGAWVDEEDRKEEMVRLTALLEADLAEEPDVGDVVFVWGSE